jgi:methylmalonyl-CoA/ethylmalonyl-CoA epimerase
MSDPLISHVGIAVADLEKSIAIYQQITGMIPSPVVEVADQQVKVVMFAALSGDEHPGGRIELIAATSPHSPIARFIERKGEGLHHICIYVDDIDARLRTLKAAGVKLIDESPRIGADGEKIAFVHPSSAGGVLLELQQRPS